MQLRQTLLRLHDSARTQHSIGSEVDEAGYLGSNIPGITEAPLNLQQKEKGSTIPGANSEMAGSCHGDVLRKHRGTTQHFKEWEQVCRVWWPYHTLWHVSEQLLHRIKARIRRDVLRSNFLVYKDCHKSTFGSSSRHTSPNLEELR